MFTGLIQEAGRVVSPSPRLHVRCRLAEQLVCGDSIAVDGVCLTAEQVYRSGFYATVMPETNARSTLGTLKPGQTVNLEPALSAGTTLGGHLVGGHVDETGTITNIKTDRNATWYTISCSKHFMPLLAEKGSVAIDGISLTVVSVAGTLFTVSVIPHTRRTTTLGLKKRGDAVNLEGDTIARYMQQALASRIPTPPHTQSLMETLLENGFAGGIHEYTL